MNKIFEANISSQVCDFLKGFLKNISSVEIANFATKKNGKKASQNA
ncbi:MAG: hypothetical protein PHP52_13425 [Bacteroidales bacterium]|nr:hypothetical protein [Bacteroidales bacterium]MDD4218122.1 hypothetical protein [Bacteroidales bacterium]MDY0140640.1 hypothetical protein [Bacteroidales bacterium]